jgi:hypothetical protein
MIQKPEINIHLLNALVDLDEWLTGKGLCLELKIIGATALHLHHIDIERMSMDIDLAQDIDNEQINEKIKEVGREHGLGDNWIDSPYSITLPEFVQFKEHSLFDGFKNIAGSYADLKTILALKISAYYDRVGEADGDNDSADIEAILESGIKLSADVLNFAIEDIKRSNKYNDSDLHITIQEIKKLAQKH